MSCSLTKPRGSLGKDAWIILRLVIRKTEAQRRQVKLPAVQKCSVTEPKTGLKRQDPPELWFSPEYAFLPPFWPWEHAGAGDGGNRHRGGSPQPREHGGCSHHLHGQRPLLGPSILTKGIQSTQRCRWTPHPGTWEETVPERKGQRHAQGAASHTFSPCQLSRILFLEGWIRELAAHTNTERPSQPHQHTHTHKRQEATARPREDHAKSTQSAAVENGRWNPTDHSPLGSTLGAIISAG